MSCDPRTQDWTVVKGPSVTRLRRRLAVSVCVGVAVVATVALELSAGEIAVARAAIAHTSARSAAAPSARAAGFEFHRIAYELHYFGSEKLYTLKPTPDQPFYQAGRSLYIRLSWDLRVYREYRTGLVLKPRSGDRFVTATGVFDLSIPDNPSLSCSAPYTLDHAAARLELNNNYVTIETGSKALAWTTGPPQVQNACQLDSGPVPTFKLTSFQAKYQAALSPHFMVPCSKLDNATGSWSPDKPVVFNGTSPAELGTVGLGQVKVFVQSTVVVTGVKCVHGQFGPPVDPIR
jgi:hypothetical protein